MGINILKTASFLPEFVADNEFFTEIVDTTEEWIESRTGILGRHILTEGGVAEMAEFVLRELTENVNPDDISLIIVSTVTADYWFPAISCVIAGKIGAVNAMCFDVSAACAGFNHILDIAEKYQYKKAIVISTEHLTKLVDYSDRSSCVLFGDGAAGFLLEKNDKPYYSFFGAEGADCMDVYCKHTLDNDYIDKIYEDINTDISENEAFQRTFLTQNGRKVYSFAVKAFPNACIKACEKAGWSVDEIDWFIPHQANFRIIETGAKNLNVSLEKFIVTIDKFGNTSSSSIPLAFDYGVKSGKIKRGQKICLVGFGSGLVFGANVFEY